MSRLLRFHKGNYAFNKYSVFGKNNLRVIIRERNSVLDINEKEYKKYCAKRAKKSPVPRDTFAAFISGGAICTFAEGLKKLYGLTSLPEETVKTLVPVTLVFIASLATGLGIFDNIAKFAGAGTLVPITGFANAVVSPAMDDKSEGLIMGVGAKMFTVAGPVIVYGVLSSALYGLVYWICGVV